MEKIWEVLVIFGMEKGKEIGKEVEKEGRKMKIIIRKRSGRGWWKGEFFWFIFEEI